MANTYSQISIQCVFAVKGRQNFISSKWSEELYKYIAATINGKGAKSLAVNGWRDHVHMFFGMEPSMLISDFVGAVKACSSGWINECKFIPGKFQWQSGYGAFSYSKSQRDTVIKLLLARKNITG